MVFLPRCPSCGALHPLAGNPPIHVNVCPNCNSPLPPVYNKSVPAILTGGSLTMRIGRAFLALGKQLTILSRRFR